MATIVLQQLLVVLVLLSVLAIERASAQSVFSRTVAAAPLTASTTPAPAPDPPSVMETACPNGVRARRSWKALSQAERNAFVAAIWTMKRSGILDTFTVKHRQAMSVHGSVLFMPYHRALLVSFENALIAASNGSITALPYWNELEDSLNVPGAPVFAQGTSGLGEWRAGPLTAALAGLTDDAGRQVTRQPRSDPPSGFLWLPQGALLANALTQFATFGQMAFAVEVSPHNQVHGLLGGHMGNPSISPADPLFWLHHAYIDLLWAVWQAVRPQNADNISTTSSQNQIQYTDRVFGYESQYTIMDTLRYQSRLCYHYVVDANPSTAAKSLRLLRRQSNNTVPDGSAAGTRRLLPVANMTDADWQRLLPSVPLQRIREVEQGLNRIASTLNAAAERGELDLATLPDVEQLLIDAARVQEQLARDDDGRDSAISSVAWASKERESASASSASSGSPSPLCIHGLQVICALVVLLLAGI